MTPQRPLLIRRLGRHLAALLYWTTYVALDAIERCHAEESVTRACVLEKLKTTDLPETPLGIPVRFDENNQVQNSRFFLFQVENGQFALIQ
jgi:hypothetical protein